MRAGLYIPLKAGTLSDLDC